MNSVPGRGRVRGASGEWLKQVKRRFAALNSDRLGRVRSYLDDRQRVVLDLLPLLFHGNHPSLPGHAGRRAPVGIANYTPSRPTLQAAASLDRDFRYRKRALRAYAVHAIFLMGSGGSVAYSDKSDLDIWLCHDPRLPPASIRQLRAKCDAITEWAEGLGLELNFFLVDAQRLRRGELDQLSNDSSGSAQYHLLLEEFYRTGILVAGRYPAWWLVPADQEHEYDLVLRHFLRAGWIHEHEFIDLGPLTTVPAEEFFGATLWQLHKAIDSPYKSVLKIILMESYAHAWPHMELLCSRFKRMVHAGRASLDALDPYVLMMERVEEYLREAGDAERLELARRCFYFKVKRPLSLRREGDDDPRLRVMASMARHWGWQQDHLLLLDARSTWKIHRVLEEVRVISAALQKSYRFLSDFARRHGRDFRINATDLNMLGRRLYSAFERKPGKVEIINPGISTDLTERQLHFIHEEVEGGDRWLLYREDLRPDSLDTPPLRRGRNLLELAAWCHFNRLVGPMTLVTLRSGGEQLQPRELFAMLDSLAAHFPHHAVPSSDLQKLQRPARVHSAVLYVNLGVDPLASHTRRGLYLTSDRADALCYGGVWKNLVLSCDLVMVTTWREVLTFHYEGEEAVLECLCDYLAWAPLEGEGAPPELAVYSYSTTRGATIARRVWELCRDLVRVFYGRSGNGASRYLLRLGHAYYLLENENGTIRHRRVGGDAVLGRVLGEARPRFSPLVLDPWLTEFRPLAVATARNRPGVVQLFFLEKGREAQIWVFDERGSLFAERRPFQRLERLLSQYRLFLERVVERLRLARMTAGEGPAPDVEVYRLHRARNGNYLCEHLERPAGAALERHLPVEVIGEWQGGDLADFTIYCGGREFSSLEFGSRLYARVAAHLLALRSAGERYPIHITDIEVSNAADDGVQTVHYLQARQVVEQALNEALENL